MTKKEMKEILTKKLGAEEFTKDYNRYTGFGWSQTRTLTYMMEMNTKRDFHEAMNEYLRG